MLVLMATRNSSKVMATAFGIALCVMFLSGTFALLDGLRSSTNRVAGGFNEGPILVYACLPLEESRIDYAVLQNLTGPYSAVRISVVNVSYSGVVLQRTRAAYVSNASLLETSLAGLQNGQVWVGEAFLKSTHNHNLTVLPGASVEIASSSATLTLTYDRMRPSILLPDEWALVSAESMLQLDSTLGDDANFLLVGEDSPDLPRLQDEGFVTTRTVAAVDFFRQGVNSLEPALWGLAAAVGGIIVVLTFTLMAIEVRNRSAELRTLRQIGASPGFVIRLIVLQSLFVSSLGAVLGLALGSILTNAVVSFLPLVGMSTFVLPAPSLEGMYIPALVALIAGLLGAISPARNASRILRKEGFSR
jgi:ABC-type antimicrobial peptide transport system permease subunit